MKSRQERVDESRRELGDGGTGVHFHGNELIAEETAPDGGRARDSRRRFEPASPRPCGARVAAAPSDLDSGQWRGSCCAVRPMSGPWAGRCGTPCADLVVQGARSGRGSPVPAGGRQCGPQGVAALRYAPAQVSGPQAASPANPQAVSILLGARTKSTSLSRR